MEFTEFIEEKIFKELKKLGDLDKLDEPYGLSSNR